MWRVVVCAVAAQMLYAGTVGAQIRFGLPAEKVPVTIKELEEGPVLITRFVIEGASADVWTQAFEILEIPKKGQPKTAAQWFEAFKASGEEHCPGGVWGVVQEDENSVLYERTTAACDGNPAQHSLNRVLYGKKKVFVLIFTSAEALEAADREAWVAVLANASAK